MNMDQKKAPSALDYLILHHVSRAYLKSIDNIARGRTEDVIRDVYEESILYLVNFIRSHAISDKGLSREARDVIRLIRRSINILDDKETPPSAVVTSGLLH